VAIDESDMRMRVAIFFLGIASAGAAHADNTNVDFDLTAGYESNVPRAASASDRASDSFRAAKLGVTRSVMLDEHGGMTFTGTFAYQNHQRFSALNNGTARLDAVYVIQPVAGYSAPWIEAAASLEGLKFADSRIRDGVIADLSVSVGKNLTDRIQLKAGGGYEKRWAAYEAVFNLNWRKAFLDISYQLRKNTVYARVTRIWGDQVFSVRPGVATYNAKATEDDTAFGNAYYAYRVGAATNTFDLGLVAPLTGSDSIVASASRYLTNADGGLRYNDSLIRITWLHRF
jgi:hypothetical protein